MPPVRTPQDMLKIMMEKVGPRTGRTYDEWLEVAKGSGVATHKALTEWLKTQGLNHNEAQWVAWGVVDPGRLEQYDRPDDLEAGLYSGKKAHLRPVYDALMAAGEGIGDDVKPFVCKTYTSLSVGTQFVIFAPRTLTTIDVELVLPPGVTGPEPFKSSNPKFSHRFRVATPDQVTPELVGWMRVAAEHVRR